MKFLEVFNVLQLFLLSNFVACETDYCLTELCSGLKHIACQNSGDFDPSCPPDRKILELSEEDRQLILNEHNQLRNKIASGQEIGFSTASMMSTMVSFNLTFKIFPIYVKFLSFQIWNNELAKLAELNARTCTFAHDQCRNTEKFKYAGQNIALSEASVEFETLNAIIKNALQNWYIEVQNTTQSEIDSYYFSSDKVIGHFTQIVNDLSNEVGCAVVQYTESDGWKSSLFVCDYARTNIKGLPIYVSGSVASHCESGTNPDFNALCISTENVEPNLTDRKKEESFNSLK